MWSEINWRNIDLNLLIAFTYLYRYQSVSKAAEQCHVSQSAMSHSLAKLRRLFNDPLFIRKGHRMCATDHAKLLYPNVEAVLEQVSHTLTLKYHFEPTKYQGTCRIGLTDYAELIFAPLIYDAIKREAPDAQVSFISVTRSNYLALFESGQLDLAIGSFNSIPERFDNQHLYTEKHVCLFDTEMISLESAFSLQAFSSFEFALVSPEGKLMSQVDQTLAHHGLSRRVNVAVANFLTLSQLLKGRKLIAIVPNRMANIAANLNHLSTIAPPIDVADFDISLVIAKHQKEDEKNSWLRRCVANVVKANK